MKVERRQFIKTGIAFSLLAKYSLAHEIFAQPLPEKDFPYSRADYTPMLDTLYGVGFHWTALSVQQDGTCLPHREAINAFNVKSFVDQVVETGAGHVLFTINHSQRMICCPNPELDRIIQGYTHERDLVMEIADALAVHNIKLALYYNHGYGSNISNLDPSWSKAMGNNDFDTSAMFRHFENIIAWMGEHYREKVFAWWFDTGYLLYWLGTNRKMAPYNAYRAGADTVTPWADLTKAAKSGFPERLVTYNPGLEQKEFLTDYQDYYAGELNRINIIPRSPGAPGGLPWYSFVTWYADSRNRYGGWVLTEEDYRLDWPPPSAETIGLCINNYHKVGGVPCFNLYIYQDGTIHEPSLSVMKKVKQIIRKS